MHWTEIPGLSQEHMEAFLQTAMQPDSKLFHHGVIPRMQPRFVSCDFVKGMLEIAYPVQDWELNPEDILHGGITSTALDSTMGTLAHYYTHVTAADVVTVTFNISFLKPILPTDTFHVIAHLESLGRNLATIRGEIRLERENILAGTANATFMALHG